MQKHAQFQTAKDELHKALLGLNRMGNKTGRLEIVSRLLPEIRNSIAESERPDEHIRNIVDRCLDFSGGLRSLLDSVRHYERSSLPVSKITRVALSVELMRVIVDEKNITENQVRLFVHNSRTPLQMTDPLVEHSTWELIMVLWGIPTPPGNRSPILRFVDQLKASGISEQNVNEIDEWQAWAIDKSQERLQKGENASVVRKNVLEKPYLTIVVKPHLPEAGMNSAKYVVTTYLWQGSNPRELDVKGYVSNFLCEAPNLVAKAIDAASLYLELQLAEMSLEFYLPDDLMQENMMHLRRSDEENLLFGIDYPILIRPLRRILDDRTGARESIRKWQIRWSFVSERIKKNDPKEARIWLCAGEENDFNEAVRGFSDQEQRLCYLGIPFSLNYQKNTGKRVLQLAIKSGIPIAVFPYAHTSSSSTDEIRDFVRSVVCDEHSDKLPWQLKNIRLRHFDSESHPSNHVMLLWDDADRIPPPWSSSPFMAPQESEGFQ